MSKFLFILFTFFLINARANTYYFSTVTGDDSRSLGEAQSPSTPWKTINKLNSIFSSLTPGDAVLFKRGETFYGSIVISKSREKYSQNVSTSISPITIGAYGNGAKPIITGLQSITKWVAIGGGVYQSTLNQSNLNLVTFQDVLQPIGRWPKVTAPNAGYLEFQSHVGTSNISSNAISTAKDFKGGEVVIRKWGWILDRGIINDQTSTTVDYTTFAAPSHPNYVYEPIDGFGFFFQNHINALTEQGDWMYEKSTNTVKMYFGSNSPTGYTVQVPTAENLIDITFSSYITIDNISFKGANSNIINLNSAYNIAITNCDMNLAGIDAINAGRSSISGDITVKNCSITNSNNNAIAAHRTPNWVIQNNSIKNTGIIRGMSISGDGNNNAISSPGSNSLIEYNVIKNTGLNAIEFRGENTILKNNFIDSFSTIKSDGGGIYTFGETETQGRKIIGNIVLNGVGDPNGRKQEEKNNPFSGNVHGIYMDGGSTGVEIIGNTAAYCASSGLELSSPVNTRVTNNTFFNNTFRQIYYRESKGAISNLTLKHNIVFAVKPDQLIAYIDGSSNTVPNWGVIDSNYYCRPIFEPNGIDTTGYSKPNLQDFPDGGIIHTYNGRFYSLDKWQALSNQDAHTKKSPVSISDVNDIRFEYNPTNSPKTFTLNETYIDVKGTVYNNTVTLAPYTSIILIKSPSASVCSATGSISLEQWSNVKGKDVSDIPLQSAPTKTSLVNMLEVQNTDDKMAARIRGYICAPVTGNYTFYISGDEGAALWLSTNDDPANKVKIASNSDGKTSYREWNKYPTQKSVQIYLVGNQRYYIEVLHKNNSAKGHVSVKWDIPNGVTEQPISGKHLSPYTAPITSFNPAYTSSKGNVFEIQPGKATMVAYPNPFRNTVRIQVTPTETGEGTLEVADLQGRPVTRVFNGRFEAGFSKTFLFTSDKLSTGVYLIKLITKTKVFGQKVTLIR